jgi:hypothetical protein
MRRISTVIISLGFMLGGGLAALAQQSNTLYFMGGVPQSNRINPARSPECTFYLGMPGLSPLRMQLSSSSLAYDDIIFPHPTADSLITFLHPFGDKQAFLDKLRPLNFVISDLGTSLVSLGFLTGAGFFSLDLTVRVDGSIYYPGDLARLVLQGAGEGETYTFNGLGTDLATFNELSVGWSGAIGNKIQIGARGKALFGLGNITTTHSTLEMTTSEDLWNIHSDMVLETSLPFAEVVYDEEGMISDILIKDELQNLKPGTLAREAFNTKNFGLGVDLGVDYRPSERWLLSASVLDIGYIQWKDEINRVSYINDYEFTGLEVNPLEFSENFTFEDYLDSSLTALGDTLAGALEFTPGGKYSRRLNTKVFIGASWSVTEYFNLGLLSRTDFLKEAIAEQVTASASVAAGRNIHFTLSYTYSNSYFKNLGTGISLNAGPLNLYVISDNVLNTVFWPQEAQSANLWFGMNLVFGYNQFKTDRDRPLVY